MMYLLKKNDCVLFSTPIARLANMESEHDKKAQVSSLRPTHRNTFLLRILLSQKRITILFSSQPHD